MPPSEIPCTYVDECACSACFDMSHRSEVSSESLGHLSFGAFDRRPTTAMQLSRRLHINSTFAWDITWKTLASIFIIVALTHIWICEDSGFCVLSLDSALEAKDFNTELSLHADGKCISEFYSCMFLKVTDGRVTVRARAQVTYLCTGKSLIWQYWSSAVMGNRLTRYQHWLCDEGSLENFKWWLPWA